MRWLLRSWHVALVVLVAGVFFGWVRLAEGVNPNWLVGAGAALVLVGGVLVVVALPVMVCGALWRHFRRRR